MIPRICHFYWGGGPLSYLQYLSIVSFKKHNPEWTINLWMPHVIEVTPPTWSSDEQKDIYTGEDFLERAKSLCTVVTIDFGELGVIKPRHEAQRADIARWYVLYEYGGVWSDIDILYVRPLDRLLGAGFESALCHHEDFFIGLLLASPQQQMFGDFYTTARDNVRRNVDDSYQSLGSEMLRYKYGSFLGIQQTYPETSIVNLALQVVYPYMPTEPDINSLFYGSDDRTTPDTLGIHWYNGSPIAKGYQNNFEKHLDNGSVISNLAKEYM